MTIFARRRIQAMLDALAPRMRTKTATGLLRRLNDVKRAEQALPAEMELALLWSLTSLGHIEIEPQWWADGKQPDAISDDLVPGRRSVIEIASTNDNSISGEQAMDAIALQVSSTANRAIKQAGDHLYFTFREESFHESGRYVRRRLAPNGYRLSKGQADAVVHWLRSRGHLQHPLHLSGDGLDLLVEYSSYKQVRFHNIFCSMPPEAHSLDDNPLFELLDRKARQLRAAPSGMLRILFLADVGSTLLRRIGRAGEIDHTRRSVSARQIIRHFLVNRSTSVDAIATFSPFKEMRPFGGMALAGRKPRGWTIGFFGTDALPSPPASLERIAAALPDPRYEGYQARSLFRQGVFSHRHTGQYLGMNITSIAGRTEETVHFPARLLLDLLAGRITSEQFRRRLGGGDGERNLFKHWLDLGMTISGAEMAPRDVDEDDDHLILHFSDDPAARPFTLPGDGSDPA